ncbi:sulfate transporter family-domain-containing protein [Absidia repens]|uniref:Sulfate transporter family-domain-containing protein n=1 Tax=Absidia repens TaxID=90262 RepID=A0A1X2J1L6_9FUNG|nr:sulfate transporter family-domain-containing protein [Absidia repens]
MDRPPKVLVVDYESELYHEKFKNAAKGLPKQSIDYVVSLFPIATWIHRYNIAWLVRDLIAGITVGIVVVPQSMGYAKIAQLPPQYGLYTAFVGLMVYCLFATSKDISIGPTAVMSLLVGQCITHITATNTNITGPEIAVTLSLLTGAIAFVIGLVRLGILVDFIPLTVVSGFMTASAVTISIGQWPKLLGLKSVNTQDPTYLIFGNFFKHLPETKLDAAFGFSALIFLYGVRFLANYLGRRYPKYQAHFFYISITRNGIAVIFGTLIAYLINIGKTTSPISILKTVPAGFQAMAVPRVDAETISAVGSSLPSAVLILVLEHVAIAKSFGRINDYSINPNQEIIAIGFTNIWGAFFGAYPSTGSFSRTAIKARSGVKTPIAGVFSGLVVILALFALTPAFYYIPDAVLSAVVIHAVSDLVSGPTYLKRLYQVSIWEFLVFVAAVVVTFFTTVDYGIYASVGLAILILLFRIARPRFYSIGRIPLSSPDLDPSLASVAADTYQKCDYGTVPEENQQPYLYVPDNDPSLGHLAEPLPEGILMLRVDESLTYPNSAYITDRIISHCKAFTRRAQGVISKGDRAWNDDTNPVKDAARAQLPLLHALIFDFSKVGRLDSSGLQAVVDAQTALNRYSGHHVEFHFVNIPDPSVRLNLIIGGFASQPVQNRLYCINSGDSYSGTNDENHQPNEIMSLPSPTKDDPAHQGYHSPAYSLKTRQNKSSTLHLNGSTIDTRHSHSSSTSTRYTAIPLPKDRYHFFHWSADNAVRAAAVSLSIREELQYYP